MLPRNPLLQLVPARIRSLRSRVESRVWAETGRVTRIAVTEARPEHRGWSTARAEPLAPAGPGPLAWGRLWDQRWWRLELPAPSGPGRRWLRWEDEAEATLHFEGRPVAGIDIAHPWVPLPEGAAEVWIESVVAQTGIWHPRATGLDPTGSTWRGAALGRRDELAWSVGHDLAVLDELARDLIREEWPDGAHRFDGIGVKPALDRVPPLLRRLLRHLDEVADAFDRGGLPAARERLAEAYGDLRTEPLPPAALLTGHAHIDLVWLWPERVGEFKAVHTFATVLGLLEDYPEFHFGYSQPASYAAVARRAPELQPGLARAIASGRWEPVGALWVESDTLLACGEALARSFRLGQAAFTALQGRPSPVLWLPDVFGYAGCLPQMMAETGVRAFATTKLSWNAVNAFPHSTFIWAGADGTEVLAHLMQEGGYNQSATVAQIRRGADAHRQADVHPEFLAPTGYGDGGGGPTMEMIERSRRLAALAGVPAARWGRIEDFFRRVESRRDRLPRHRGELYFEYHRGTYTTHAAVKAAFRDLERALQTEEAARCVKGAGPMAPEPWQRLVFAQFHDYIPGSSVHEVYAEGLAEHRDLSAASRERVAELAAGSGDGWFNPLPTARRWVDGDRLVHLPPLAAVPREDLVVAAPPPVAAAVERLANDRLEAGFDAEGRLCSLVVDGAEVRLERPAGEFWLYPDHPHAYEAWDIDRPTLALGEADRRAARAEVVRPRGVVGEVAFHRGLGRASEVTLRYRLVAGSPALEIVYEVDWREPEVLLKVLFPTSYRGTSSRQGAPFGSVRRPQWEGGTAAEAMWEIPFSRWLTVTDDGETDGLWLATESTYGASVREGVLGVSLVRSVKITSEERGAQRGSHPEPLRRTRAEHVESDLGRHTFRLAVGRFQPGAPLEEQPATQADLLFTPCRPWSGPAASAGLLGVEGAPSLTPAWAEPEPGGAWVLRLHETLGRAGVARVVAAPGWTLRPVNLGGAVGPALVEGRLPYRPYAIHGVRFERADSAPAAR